MPIATLTDLKIHLDITNTDSDAELQEMLDAAVEIVENTVGPVTPASVTETHYGVYTDTIVLNKRPVVSLTSVATWYGALASTLVPADFVVDADQGLLRYANGGWFAGAYIVTYMAGRSVVPASFRLATLIIADQLFESQRVPGASRFGSRGGEPPVPMGFAIPNRAKELLDVPGYRRGPAIA